MSFKGRTATNARGATSITRNNANRLATGKYGAVYPGTAAFIVKKSPLDSEGIADSITVPAAAGGKDTIFDGITAAGTPASDRKHTSGVYRSGVVPGVNPTKTTFAPLTRLRYVPGKNHASKSTEPYHGIPNGTDCYVPQEVTDEMVDDDLRGAGGLARAVDTIVAQVQARPAAANAAQERTAIVNFIREIAAAGTPIGKSIRKQIVAAVERARRADVICLDQWRSGHWCDLLLARR